MLSHPPRRRPRGPLLGRDGTVSRLLQELDLLPGRAPTLERQLGLRHLGAGDEGGCVATAVAVVVALVVVVAVVVATAAAVVARGVVVAIVAVARCGRLGGGGGLADEDRAVGDERREGLAVGQGEGQHTVGERRDRRGRRPGDLARVRLLLGVLLV